LKCRKGLRSTKLLLGVVFKKKLRREFQENIIFFRVLFRRGPADMIYILSTTFPRLFLRIHALIVYDQVSFETTPFFLYHLFHMYYFNNSTNTSNLAWRQIWPFFQTLTRRAIIGVEQFISITNAITNLLTNKIQKLLRD